VLVVDDMIATAGSIAQACEVLQQRGARDIYLCATHAVLCGNAIEKLERTRPREVVVTDTIPIGERKRRFITVLSVAGLLAEAILRIHKSESVSSLFLK
jgi:ribose-phosphate pyrophosphokinase